MGQEQRSKEDGRDGGVNRVTVPERDLQTFNRCMSQ